MEIKKSKIQQVAFDVQCLEQELAYSLQNSIISSFNNSIRAILDNHFNNFSKNNLITLPRVELDLGKLTVSEIENELPTIFEKKLKEYLNKLRNDISIGVDHADIEVIPYEKQIFDFLYHYFRNGIIPWNLQEFGDSQRVIYWINYLAENFPDLLHDLGLYFEEDNTRKRLVLLIGNENEGRAVLEKIYPPKYYRLIRQFEFLTLKIASAISSTSHVVARFIEEHFGIWLTTLLYKANKTELSGTQFAEYLLRFINEKTSLNELNTIFLILETKQSEVKNLAESQFYKFIEGIYSEKIDLRYEISLHHDKIKSSGHLTKQTLISFLQKNYADYTSYIIKIDEKLISLISTYFSKEAHSKIESAVHELLLDTLSNKQLPDDINIWLAKLLDEVMLVFGSKVQNTIKSYIINEQQQLWQQQKEKVPDAVGNDTPKEQEKTQKEKEEQLLQQEDKQNKVPDVVADDIPKEQEKTQKEKEGKLLPQEDKQNKVPDVVADDIPKEQEKSEKEKEGKLLQQEDKQSKVPDVVADDIPKKQEKTQKEKEEQLLQQEDKQNKVLDALGDDIPKEQKKTQKEKEEQFLQQEDKQDKVLDALGDDIPKEQEKTQKEKEEQLLQQEDKQNKVPNVVADDIQKEQEKSEKEKEEKFRSQSTLAKDKTEALSTGHTFEQNIFMAKNHFLVVIDNQIEFKIDIHQAFELFNVLKKYGFDALKRLFVNPSQVLITLIEWLAEKHIATYKKIIHAYKSEEDELWLYFIQEEMPNEFVLHFTDNIPSSVHLGKSLLIEILSKGKLTYFQVKKLGVNKISKELSHFIKEDSQLIPALIEKYHKNRQSIESKKQILDYLQPLLEPSSFNIISNNIVDGFIAKEPKKLLGGLSFLSWLQDVNKGAFNQEEVAVFVRYIEKMVDTRNIEFAELLIVFSKQELDLIYGLISASYTNRIKSMLRAYDFKNKPKTVQQDKDQQAVPQKTQYKEFTEGEVVFIRNAGAVLLNPYILMLFKRLKLVDGKKFVNDQMKVKAMQILEYLCTKEEQPEEHDLVLNKVLVDFPLHQPIEQFFKLTKEEKDLCDGLLEAMIKNWSALKNTTIDNLRASFLIRNGKLLKEQGNWRLSIEQKSIDILLDKLPWAYGMTKLPWMEFPLITDWR